MFTHRHPSLKNICGEKKNNGEGGGGDGSKKPYAGEKCDLKRLLFCRHAVVWQLKIATPSVSMPFV